jgi:hypothetical protein
MGGEKYVPLPKVRYFAADETKGEGIGAAKARQVVEEGGLVRVIVGRVRKFEGRVQRTRDGEGTALGTWVTDEKGAQVGARKRVETIGSALKDAAMSAAGHSWGWESNQYLALMHTGYSYWR